MKTEKFDYFQGGSFSDLFPKNSYGFILNYPTTASWAKYANLKKYFIQDGSDEFTKVAYDKICQKEPWKNLSVLGDDIEGILITVPRKVLFSYWRDQFGYKYDNIEILDRQVYIDYLNHSDRQDKFITLFPFDFLLPEKHAVNPDVHYQLLSKITLKDSGAKCPNYESYNLNEISLLEIPLPEQFPYLIKTSHGLSGEGTYIIKDKSDLEYSLLEIKKYREIKLLDYIIVSDFVKNAIENYCVQFYLSAEGQITLIGVTGQLVTADGKYLGGLIDYNADMSKFYDLISAIGKYAHEKGYFGVIGFDVLENKEGELYVIDANFRVNGSTPLCLQRHRLLKANKPIAKFSGDYRMNGTLDSILVTLKTDLQQQNIMILSALERVKYGKIYCDIYAIVAGETIEQMQEVEASLATKGLQMIA